MGKVVLGLERVNVPPKALLFDIDGTLVRRDHTISDEVRSRILRLEKEVGVVVGFATGRSLFGASRILSMLPVNGPSMFFSGSLVCRPQSGEVLFEQGMSTAELESLLAAARAAGVYCEFYTRDGYFVEEWSPLAELHSEYMQQLPEVVPLMQLASKRPILKVVLMGQKGVDADQLATVVNEHSHIPCGVSYGAAHPDIVFANFTSALASRPIALRVITEALGLGVDEMASFGDASADLEFLTRVKFGVAMGNASDDVKGQTPFVTDSVEGRGVAAALDWLFGAVGGVSRA
jgi:Cof subfamily protein (haloacid dehalogenase superfamily)